MSNRESLTSYAECDSFLGSKDSKALRYKVRLERDGADIVVRHHATAIIRYCPDGTVVLDCAGFRSKSTKDNLCRYSGYSVWQQKFVWFIHNDCGETVEFEDGMVLGNQEVRI